MLPHKHAIVSAAIGAVAWMVSGDPIGLPVAVAAGVLPDLDHVADYMYFRRWAAHRLILPLHGYEYALLGGGVVLISGNEIAAAATLCYLIHLLADQVENRTHVSGYWLIFRAWHRFRVEAISTVPEAAMRGREEDMRRLHQWLWRLKGGSEDHG